MLGNEHPVWHWSEAVDGATSGTAGGEVEVDVETAGDAGTLDRLADRTAPRPTAVLPTELVLRASCGCSTRGGHQ